MMATVTAVPYKNLNPNERLILDSLRDGAKNTNEISDITRRSYHPVSRALKNLIVKGWVELDYEMSGGKVKYYCLKQAPTDGIGLIVNTGLDQEMISFNRYLESVAKQLGGGRRPRIETESEAYYSALAMLGVHAAQEFVAKGAVKEAQLLELRARVQGFVDALKEAYAVGQQILDNENFWHADMLADGVMRKTDRYLTAADMVTYARIIIGAFNKDSADELSGETNNEEEETDENGD